MLETKALTWDNLADDYDKLHPGLERPARTLLIDTIYEWAKRQTDKYIVSEEGTIHYKVYNNVLNNKIRGKQ